MTDRQSFLLAIAAAPDDDLPRLAFADFLDEHGDSIQDKARAHYIRQTIDIHREANKSIYDGMATKMLNAMRIKCDADWRRGPRCACRQHGGITTRMGPCPTCDDTSDAGGLMERLDSQDDRYVSGAANWVHRVDFARGFPGTVHCELADVVGRCEECGGSGNGTTALPGGVVPKTCCRCSGYGYLVADWARRVVRAHPVTRFIATNRRPHTFSSGYLKPFGWTIPGGANDERSELPEWLFLLVVKDCGNGWESAEAANGTLARVLAQLARQESPHV